MTEKLITVGDLRLAQEKMFRLQAIVSALLRAAGTDPYCSIAHWVEHGPVSAILSEERRFGCVVCGENNGGSEQT